MYNHDKRIPSQKYSQNVQLCNLCYKLLSAENRLMQYEKMMAGACSIPYESYVPLNSPSSPLIPEMLHQWRCCVYVEHITDINSKSINPNQVYTIKFSLFDNSENAFPSKEIKKSKSEDVYIVNVNQIRVNYFFSLTKKITTYISNIQIVFSLCDSSGQVGRGICTPFQGMESNDMDIGCGTSHKMGVYLFTNEMSKLDLKVHCGMCYDGVISSHHMQIYRATQAGIYFPDDGYYSCNSLPIEWIKQLYPSEKIEYAKDQINLNQKQSARLFTSSKLQLLAKKNADNSEYDKALKEFTSLSPQHYSHIKSKLHFASNMSHDDDINVSE